MNEEKVSERNNNLVDCKACGKSIAKGVKKCPSCGKDQRNFFAKHKILTVVLAVFLLAGIGGALSDSEDDNSSVAGTNETEKKEEEKEVESDYITYNYGDVIQEKNVMKKPKYKMPNGLEVIFESQTIITADEINKANQFNKADNDVSILEITFKNNTEEVISFNAFGFSFATHNGTQLKDFSFTFNVLPGGYDSMDSFSSGDLMPGKQFTRIQTAEIPDSDSIETVKYKNGGVDFTVELPKP